MAEVTLEIAGRSYALGCRDGEEAHLLNLARLVDAKARDADRAMGSMTENRQLLVTALLLADALNERPGGNTDPVSQDDQTSATIERLAEQVEKLAAALETGGLNA